MTDHVRTGYRNHRKAALGLALLLVAATATVAIPFASGATKTLQFVTAPPNPWQQGTPASVAVAVFAGGQNPQNTQNDTTSITATGAGGINAFVVGTPQYSSGVWTWNVTPTSNASGSYTFTATVGTSTQTSSTFRVWQFVCPASGIGPSCDATSNLSGGKGKLKIANTLESPIALDFEAGGAPAPVGCNNDPNNPGDNNELTHTWNRVYYVAADGITKVYFPAVALDFTADQNDPVLKVTYMLRNSEWTLSTAARGNNDIEFCAEARHQNSTPAAPGAPFFGKYGEATLNPITGMYSAVLKAVANASKVKSGGDPAVCGSGNTSLPTGPAGSSETWRTWTICIPYDWDWGFKV